MTSIETTSNEANENKFLSFRIGKEEFGVEILRVREIIGVIDVTPLPQTPDYVKGVINLRGKIIPVIELRTKFGLDAKEYTEETCIIVVEVSDGGEEHFHMGVIVDSVSEVLDIHRDHIEPAPRFGNSLNTSYIFGMGKVNNQVLILLDIDRVMTFCDLSSLAEVANSDTSKEEHANAA
ncbi:Positive regulator of CheA protein activity (CheW) [hydrothermal vent metagenome]|uniref:Positive regulator of CheA protein activity (CheW) n=1 Tax=hydrothermal vent metagenome TaxID=652676 RepID=A0A3B1DNY2_9ZZZZ